jgi:hypothetical protein
MRILVVLLTLLSNNASADSYVTCVYKFAGVEFATIAGTIYDDGTPASSVQITHQGSTHKETATTDIIGPGEFAHFWISKQDPENDIEVIMYKPAQPDGDSKMINHHMPFGDTMWAQCTGIPQT